MAKKGYSLGSLADYTDTKVAKTQKVNGKPLSGDITLTPSDVKSVAVDGSSTITGTLNVNTGTGLIVKNSAYPGIVLWATSLAENVQKKHIEVDSRGGLNFITRRSDGTNNGVVVIEAGKDGSVYHTGNRPSASDIGALPASEVNGNSPWSELIGKVPRISSAGVIELGKYLDLHDTNSTKDYDVRLAVAGANKGLSIGTAINGKTASFGSRNDSWFHMETDAVEGFYSYNPVVTDTLKGFHVNNGKIADNKPAGNFTCESGGGSFATWQQRKTALQVSCPDNGSSYPIWRASRWGDRHLAAMEAYAGGSSTSDPLITMHIGGTTNAFQFYQSGDLQANRNGNFNDVYIRSDKRLKTDLKPLEGALEKVCKLQGYTYDKHASLTDDKIVGREAGILAQDLEVVLPEATHTAEDTQMTISNSGVNALLVEAVKELTAKVEELERKLEERG